MLVSNFETLISAYGIEEEDLNDHLEDHKMMKLSRENKLVRSKRHIEIIQYDRVLIQHECHMWLKNFITMAMLPKQLLLDVFDLRSVERSIIASLNINKKVFQLPRHSLCLNFSVSHYSEVRIVAQGFLQKLLIKAVPEGHSIIMDKLLGCLETKEGDPNSQLAKEASADEAKGSDQKKVNEERLKGALHILMEDRAVFFGAWKFMSRLLPALIRAQG